jgi:hypothetical protein
VIRQGSPNEKAAVVTAAFFSDQSVTWYLGKALPQASKRYLRGFAKK